MGFTAARTSKFRVTPEHSPAANFDSTYPRKFVTGLITERGVCEATRKHPGAFRSIAGVIRRKAPSTKAPSSRETSSSKQQLSDLDICAWSFEMRG